MEATAVIKRIEIMRAFLILIIFVLLLVGSSCENAKEVKKDLIVENPRRDLGKVMLEDTLLIKFKMKNDSAKEIYITGVEGDCGCIMPTKKRDTLTTGSSSELVVNFVPSQLGIFEKNIVVRSTGNPEFHSLFFKGEAIDADKATR